MKKDRNEGKKIEDETQSRLFIEAHSIYEESRAWIGIGSIVQAYLNDYHSDIETDY